jgi:glycerol-3-phosphate dehydrogenase (NAD(P)+)
MPKITVVGAGSWGTALAVHLARLEHDVWLWARDPRVVEDMQGRHANAVYLPDVLLPSAVTPTADLHGALARAETVVWAVPSHGLRPMLAAARDVLPAGAVVVSATKGLEAGSWQRMSEVLAEELPPGTPIVVLSGPSFAGEVARGLPTAVCAASMAGDAVAQVMGQFRGPRFRLYASDDVVGVEIGGAYKNVIAIAAGVVEGLGLGHNALAGLVTRGLAEMTRLAHALGGRRDTMAGLSGLGDLVLTCTGHASRNLHVGMELGRGRSLPDVLAGMKMVAEGVNATRGMLALGRAHGVELPIAEQMEGVLAGAVHPMAATEALMLRPQKPE